MTNLTKLATANVFAALMTSTPALAQEECGLLGEEEGFSEGGGWGDRWGSEAIGEGEYESSWDTDGDWLLSRPEAPDSSATGNPLGAAGLS